MELAIAEMRARAESARARGLIILADRWEALAEELLRMRTPLAPDVPPLVVYGANPVPPGEQVAYDAYWADRRDD